MIQVSERRAQVVLNGPWKFLPDLQDSLHQPGKESSWGWIRVPGNWAGSGPGIMMRGKGPAWDAFIPDQTPAVWYERELTIPADWTGKSIILRLDRVSTDAIVYLDGQRVGEAKWPGGEVDLTDGATAGKTHTLRLQVLAADNEKVVLNFMGTIDSQVTQQAAKLDSRGLIGDVRLLSRPQGAFISDLFIRPSVRTKSLAVDVALSGAKPGEKVELTARLLNRSTGEEEKRFTSTLILSEGAAQLSAEWPWEDPRLWDVGQPELYVIRLAVKGAGIDDEAAATFGFREFWIDGGDFYLNGSRIRLRPVIAPTEWNNAAGVREGVRGTLKGMLEAGFNLTQIWPNDEVRRGTSNFWPMWYEEADDLGILVSGVAPSMNGFIVDSSWRHTWPARKPEYEAWVREPGRTGHYLPTVSRGAIERYGRGERPSTLTRAGEALISSNGPTLAYLAGAPAFTDKTHQFWGGATVEKQVALLNDSRADAEWSFQWSAEIDGERIATGRDSGRISVAETLLKPISFSVPEINDMNRDGVITLEATIAGEKHSDTFPFRLYARPAAAKRTIAVLDPVGETTRMLQSLGYTTRPWDEKSTDGVLVVGRTALGTTANSANELAARIGAFANAGGRELVMAQKPELLDTGMGFRVAPYVLRRVFTVSASHPLTSGLDEVDLRDWSATSTLVEPSPDVTNGTEAGRSRTPKYGYRWGNEGMVTAAPVEKPHHAGWRPILQCEFDLAWSPLMELDHGNGRIVWAQLELEDNFTTTPTAAILLHRLISYTAEAPLTPRAARTD